MTTGLRTHFVYIARIKEGCLVEQSFVFLKINQHDNNIQDKASERKIKRGS
jgi:hypothetical protein